MKKQILVIIALLFLLSSCATLQGQKGYNKYPKNTDWKIRKL